MFLYLHKLDNEGVDSDKNGNETRAAEEVMIVFNMFYAAALIDQIVSLYPVNHHFYCTKTHLNLEKALTNGEHLFLHCFKTGYCVQAKQLNLNGCYSLGAGKS